MSLARRARRIVGRCRFAAAIVLVVFSAAPSPAADRLSEAAGWLQRYLQIDTTNPPGNEHRAAAYLANILHREGIATELLIDASGRTSLYARLAAQPGETAPALVLMHHVDTVAPGPGWTVEPFSGELRDERLWGRGAIDAKSLGIAQLAAFIAVHRAGEERYRDLIYLAVADEEAGGEHGTRWLLERHPERFADVDAVLNEGGSNRVGLQGLAWWGIEVTQKRPLWLEIRSTGRGGHGSNLNLHSATHKLLRGLGQLVEAPPEYRVSDAARNYFAALAELENDRWRKVFTNLDDYIQPGKPPSGLMPGMPNWFVDTVQVTMLEASEKINVIPPQASARIDVRLLPDTDAESFLERIQGLVGERLEIEVLLSSPPAAPSPTSGPVYRLLEQVLGPEGPVVPAFIPGFTDSRYFRERGIAAYGFSPFAVAGPDLRGIHGPDERIPVAEFDRGVQRLGELLTLYVNTSDF